MTLQEVKDQWAKKMADCSWNTVVGRTLNKKVTKAGLKNLEQKIDEIARLYAAEKCKEQREICAKEAISDEHPYVGVDTDTIINADPPKFD